MRPGSAARSIRRAHHVNPGNLRPMKTAPSLRFAALALAVAATAAARAGEPPAPPQYHLVPIEVPGTNGVYVADINDAGLTVGYAISDDDFATLPFLWRDGAATVLPIPEDRDDGYATGINDLGQIVGHAARITDSGAQTTALLWDAADPSQFIEIDGPAGTALNPDDINEGGVVVGLAATEGQFNAFQWTAEDGFIDDGVPPFGPGTQAYWAAINEAGTKVGGWYFPGSATHATTGQVGTPGIGPIAAGVDQVASRAAAINAAGVAVGEMDVDGNGSLEAVAFANGLASELPGARLGLAAGTASDINDAGVIVGRAQDFGTLQFKAFVHVDGTSYDIAAQADNGDLYEYLLNGVAVNASGTIAGTARGPEFSVASFVAVPLTDGGSDLSVTIAGPDTFATNATVPLAIRFAGNSAAALASAVASIRIDAPAGRVALQAPEGWQCSGPGGTRFAVDCSAVVAPGSAVATFNATVATGGRIKLPVVTVRAQVSAGSMDPQPGNDRATLQSRMARSAPVASRAR